MVCTLCIVNILISILSLKVFLLSVMQLFHNGMQMHMPKMQEFLSVTSRYLISTYIIS